MRNSGSIGFLVGLVLSVSLLFCSCGGKYDIFKESRIIMGTVVEITVGHREEEIARNAIQAAFEEFERLERLLGEYHTAEIAGSEEGEKEITPAGEIFDLLADSLEISRLTDGAFDITVGPLTALWAFDRGGDVPSEEALRSALERVGYEKLELDHSRRTVKLSAGGMKLDLGGIGKGYAVDRAAFLLKRMGIDNAIIDAGGDLRLLGSRPGKDFWRIGIRHPREASRLLLSLDLSGTAIVTSGDYERFFLKDGIRYHHILDPWSGNPAGGCQSVTVIAPSAREADAYATAAFVMGPEKGLEFLRSRPEAEGIIVDREGEVLWTGDNFGRR